MFGQVKAIVFDLDDTLCAYWEAVKIALIQTFEDVSSSIDPILLHKTWVEQFNLFCPTIKKTDWYPKYLKSGEPTRTELMRRALEVNGLEDINFAKQLSQTYMENRAKNLKLFPESLEVLQAIKSRYRLGVLTNGPEDVQRQELSVLNITHFFDGIWIEGETKVGKPLVEAFKNVEEFFGFEPHEILMVGNDFSHDIRPAAELGWRTVWVRKESDVPLGREDKAKFQPTENDPHADLIVGDLRELLRNLDQG